MVNVTPANLLIIMAAYLTGGLSTGYWLVRLRKKVDIREYGSGGFGARNVGRLLGRSGFLITLTGDVLKGVFVVGIARVLDFSPGVISAVVIAVIMGHVWPVYLHFKGGKGIATALGAFLVLDYTIILITVLLSSLLYGLTRKFNSSWGVTVLALPFITFVTGYPLYLIVALSASIAVILFAHRENFRKESFTGKNIR